MHTRLGTRAVKSDKIAKIAELRRAGVPKEHVAKQLRCSRSTVERYELGYDSFFKSGPKTNELSAAELLARLAEIPPDTRSLTGRILGDPLPGRSALDRRA